MEKAGNFGTAEIRAVRPGEVVTLKLEQPSDIYNLRAKAYRWNDIEGSVTNCRVIVRKDKEGGSCRLIKELREK